MIAFVVASLAYFMGFAMAFDMGYEGGVNAGNATGYTLGFQMGNFSGYLAGFSSGFNSGNATGYAEGYATGNAQGMKTGNHTGYTTGYSTGYSAGYIESNMNWVEHGHGVRDPTYQEAWAFVQLDQTDKNEYNDTYVCRHFACDFNNNALEAGYRVAFVLIAFPESSHAIVGFNTTDRGMIFIEPQTDEVMKVEVGRSYWGSNGYLRPTNYDDTIVECLVIW